MLTAKIDDLTARGVPTFTMGTAVVNIDNNVSHGRGGGFYVTDGVVDLRGASAGDISISNNSIDPATTGNERRAGGFWASGGSRGTQVRIDNGVIDGHETPRDGGGFYIRDGASVELNNTDITNNKSFLDGGGFRVEAVDSKVIMNGGTISGNIANNGNSSTARGGGFRTNGAVVMTDVTVSNNKNEGLTTGNLDRRGGGGAIDGQGSLTATNVTFDGNQSMGIGAGLYTEGNVTATKGTGGNGLSILNSSYLTTDQRRDGAGVYITSGAEVDWTLVVRSTAMFPLFMVVGVRIDGSADVTFREVTISNNKTQHHAGDTDTNALGGGIYVEGPTILEHVRLGD